MTIRVGTASPNTQATTKLTLAHLESIARRAADQGVDILLLPEAFIGGYPRNTTFGAVVGSRSAEGRESFAQYFDKAVDLGDTVGEGSAGAGLRWVRRQLPGYEDGGKGRGDGTREELERIARDTGVFIVVGCIEKAGGSLWCSVPYICPSEGIIGKRRKVKPVCLPLSSPLPHSLVWNACLLARYIYIHLITNHQPRPAPSASCGQKAIHPPSAPCPP